MTILVVDDDADVQSVLERVLGRAGWTVICVSDTRKAREVLIKERPAAVLVDLMLGQENGWDTLRLMREATSAPILVVTGLGVNEDMVEDARVMGAQGVVGKPFDSEELVERLRRLLGWPPPGSVGKG